MIHDGRVKYFRVNDEGTMKPAFSRYGDTIAITYLPDTDSVNNLTTGQNYTYGGEHGTEIPDIDNFPLFDSERENLKKFRGF